MKKNIYKIICLIVGSFLMAFSIKCIIEPAGLVTGGFAGVAVIIEKLISVPLWLTNFALNIPLFIVAFLLLGKKKMLWSMFTTAMLTAFIGLIPEKVFFPDDMFISMVSGSIMMGTGLGLILSLDVTSGGVDLLAELLHSRYTGIKTVWLMFAIDGIIIIFGVLVFGILCGIYSVISVYIVSFISDKIIEGPKTSKAVYIISDKYREIAECIMESIGRGVTGFNSMGMYSDKDGKTLLCVAGKREIPVIKKLVMGIDKNAFMIISGVAEVHGEGFL